jgi:hypothetical protein
MAIQFCYKEVDEITRGKKATETFCGQFADIEIIGHSAV